MKKIIFPVLAISMLALVLSPGLAIAADTENGDITGSGEPPMTVPEFEGGLDIWKLLGKALNWFFNAAIFVAALFIVYAGWQYVTAGGDEEKAKKGLNSLIYALIGVGIALLAKGLIYMIGTFMGETIKF